MIKTESAIGHVHINFNSFSTFYDQALKEHPLHLTENKAIVIKRESAQEQYL